LQFFVGLPGYQMEASFVPSLLVEVRKRMGKTVFDVFEAAIIDPVESAKAGKTKTSGKKSDQDDDDPPSVSGGGSPEEAPEHQGKLILDATVAPQAIRYPTDLSLLNEAREFSEQIIDKLYPKTDWNKKPRTYREKARKAYLAVAKQRRPSGKVRRRGIKQQSRTTRIAGSLRKPPIRGL
jgi:transposase, IS5 family